MSDGNNTKEKWDYATYTELESVVEEMNKHIDAVIVEGKRDKEAMKEIGYLNEIVMYSGSSFSDMEFIEYLRNRYINKKVAILTDYDRKGKKFNKKLEVWLGKEGIKVKKVYREKIGRILGVRGLKCIEAVNALKKRYLYRWMQ